MVSSLGKQTIAFNLREESTNPVATTSIFRAAESTEVPKVQTENPTVWTKTPTLPPVVAITISIDILQNGRNYNPFIEVLIDMVRDINVEDTVPSPNPVKNLEAKVINPTVFKRLRI